MSHVKLPGRASSPNLHRTSLHHPTRFALLTAEFLQDEKIKDLTFNMNWDVSPTLFEALYGFKGSPQ